MSPARRTGGSFKAVGEHSQLDTRAFPGTMCLYAFGSLLCHVVAPSEPMTSLAICDRGQPVFHWMVQFAVAAVASSSVKVRSVQKPPGEIVT